LWRKELERDPSQRLYHRIAEALLKTGRPAAALDIADKGLFIHDKKYLTCTEAKGLALLALGRYATAVETLKPVAAQLGSVDTKRKLALALFGAGFDEEALALCRELLRSNPFDRETKQLLAKGREALPPPITDETPLPEDDETAEIARPIRSAVEPETKPTSRPVAPAIAPPREPPPAPRPVVVTPPPDKPPPEPTRIAAEKPPAMGIEGLVTHVASEAHRPLEAEAAPEAEELVEDFFRRMDAAESVQRLRPVRAPEAASPPSGGSPDLEVAAEERSVEYDPTEGIHANVDVEEVDVFGDLAAESKPDAPTPTPVVEAAATNPAANATAGSPAPADVATSPAEPATESEPPPTELEQPDARGLRGWFRRRRAKKEQ
jgi:tetratricopeptide (TPR) repeat protein